MSDDAVWQPLLDELDRWQQRGRVATLWLRDDDAVEPTVPLERLLTLSGHYAVPTTLAVIPAFTGEALAHRLATAAHVEVTVHGWSHDNFAPAGEKKQELGGHRPAVVVLASLEKGLAQLTRLHRSRFVPVLVPPWNRIDAKLIPELSGIGYRALSVFGPEKDLGLRAINSHVDVMDWRGTRGGRDAGVLIKEMAVRLRAMEADGGTLGLLTHHLVHDDAVWTFLETLFERTVRHPGCTWTGLSTLVDDLRQ